MLCSLSRWMISRAEDTGKELPRIVARHVRRCGACGAYARAAASLTTRLKGERTAWLAAVPGFSAGLERKREERETAPRTVDIARPTPRRSWLALGPLSVAASLIVLVAAGLVLLRVVPRETATSPADRMAARAAIRTLTSAPGGLQGVFEEAESPLDRERRVLERSIASAAEYLQARLNVKIERKATPKSL